MFRLQEDECGSGDAGDGRRVEADRRRALKVTFSRALARSATRVDASDHGVERLVCAPSLRAREWTRSELILWGPWGGDAAGRRLMLRKQPRQRA